MQWPKYVLDIDNWIGECMGLVILWTIALANCVRVFFFFWGRGEGLNFAMIWCVIYIFETTFRVRLNIAYFVKNWKLKIIKKIVKKLLYTRGILFICLNALFMSNEQCTKHWSVKKEKKGLKRKMSKRECNPNAHLEEKKKGRS